MNQTKGFNVIGTASAPATLTDDYADNTLRTSVEEFRRLHLDFDYTPKAGETDRYISIRIRYSNDNGVTWRERTVKINGTTETLLYPNVPLIFPGTKTSTGGTKYSGVFDEDGFTDELIEISAKEDSAGNHGTLFVGATLADNLSS